jgi:hypothetical protein
VLLGVPAWALLVLAVTAGAWLLLVAGLTTATRPRPVEPGPPTLDLGGPEPPAVVNLLTGGWRMTEDALSATLLDLAARDLFDLLQQGPEPDRTVVRLRAAAPADLLPYERRVHDRVARLAAGGIVPVAALARGNSGEASRWWKAFRREVILDAQRRGLSRNRWGAGVTSLVSVASMVVAAAAALIAYHASEDGGPMVGVAIFTWGGLTAWVRSRNRQRDTPAGREAAARWMGVRDHLGRNEVFGTLPPAAVAIWDRYLAYGAAAGVAGTASRVLSFGAQDERLAWSAYGGSWHKVRIRYPGMRIAEGRHPVVSASLGVAAIVIGWYGSRLALSVRDGVAGWAPVAAADTRRFLETSWPQLALFLLAAGFVALAVWGGWVVLRSVLDLAGRRTFEAEVLRVRTVRDDEGQVQEYQVALDDGRSPSTRAWPVRPARWPGLSDRDVVSVTVGPWLHHVSALSVVRRGPGGEIDDGDPGLDSQVVEEPVRTSATGWDAVLGAGWAGPFDPDGPGGGTTQVSTGTLGGPGPAGPGAAGRVDPAALFSAAEVGAALGQPVNPPGPVDGGPVTGVLGLRMAEFAAVGGSARVLVQVATGRMAGALGAGTGEPLPGGGVLRDGSVVVRGAGAVVAVHVRHAPGGTAEPALRHLAALAARRLNAGPHPDAGPPLLRQRPGASAG